MTRRRLPRNDAAVLNANVLLEAEIAFDTTNDELRIGDGVTLGGKVVGVGANSFLQAGTGAVTRTSQAKQRDIISFEDFGAVGNDTNDDTAEIQAAVDAVSLAGGGELNGAAGKIYKISAAILLKTNVRINLNGGIIKQYTANTPILKTPTGVAIQKWAVRGGKLRFNTQQTSAQTNGVGILLADGAVSYDWIIEDVQIEYACDGIKAPATANSYAFMGVITNMTAFSSARWAINMDTVTGAYTNISCTNCWSAQLPGIGPALSKGFRFKNGSMLRLNSLFADHITGEFLELTSCTGSIGEITLEAAVINQAGAGIFLPVVMSDSPMSIDSLKFVSCSFTTSGGGEIYMMRPTSSGADFSINVRDFQSVGCTYSGTNIFEIVPGGPVRLYNEIAKLDRAVSLADFSVLKKIRVWNGDTLIDREGGRYVLYGLTAPPAGEAWDVGDRAINLTIAKATPVKEWACVVAGTPGTWSATSWIVSKDTTANRPTLTASNAGVTYLDTTLDADGKPITWTGTAWVDATGLVV